MRASRNKICPTRCRVKKYAFGEGTEPFVETFPGMESFSLSWPQGQVVEGGKHFKGLNVTFKVVGRGGDGDDENNVDGN